LFSQVSSAITPIGHGKDQIVKSLLNGISGIKPLREGRISQPLYSFQSLWTVDYPIDYDFKRNHRKTMGPVAYYGLPGGKGSSGAVWTCRGFYQRPEGWVWHSVQFTALRQYSEIFTASSLELPINQRKGNRGG